MESGFSFLKNLTPTFVNEISVYETLCANNNGLFCHLLPLRMNFLLTSLDRAA